MTSQRIKSWLFGALCLALFFRGITAFVAYGPQAVDDYSHGLLPTFEMLRGQMPELPDWRSPLLIWSFYPFAKLASLLGLTVSFDIFRVILFALAVFSLFGIVAFGRFVLATPGYFQAPLKDPSKKSLLFILPLLLISLHGILSFAVTRAFGESVATTLVLVALLAMDRGLGREGLRNPQFWLGSLLLGLACLYRYQVGVLAVGYVGYLLFTKRYAHFAILALAGVVTAAFSGVVDGAYGRVPLETLYNYFYVNRNGGAEWTVQPWHATWTAAAGIFLIPFTLPFFRQGLRGLARWEKVLIGLILLFVFAHSLIPHKEERFLYPIAPLELILLGRFWAKNWGSAYEKYFFRPAIGALLVVVLFITAFSNSQSGEYEPILRADRVGGPVVLWDVDSLLGPSFFRERLVFAPVQYQSRPAWPTGAELVSDKDTNRALLLVTSNADLLPSLEAWTKAPPAEGLACTAPEKIQSLADRLIYALNAKQNVRRRPSWVSLCRWTLPIDAD